VGAAAADLKRGELLFVNTHFDNLPSQELSALLLLERTEA
jgi:hypothetical protein